MKAKGDIVALQRQRFMKRTPNCVLPPCATPLLPLHSSFFFHFFCVDSTHYFVCIAKVL